MKIRAVNFMSFWLLGVGVALAATVEEIAVDPSSWPAEVTISVTTRATILEKGQPAGAMLLGAGKKLVVNAISVEGVTGKTGSSLVRVPVEKTDLLKRVEAITAAPPGSAAPAAGEEAKSAASAAAPSATPVASAPSTAEAAPKSPSIMQRRLAGKLVKLQGGSLQAMDAASLAGVKYYALYYSASWCGPCRQFTPEFVAAYKKIKAQHPEFEVVFISRDNSTGAMRDYMRDDAMAWPAVKYDQRESDRELMRYMGPGIPCLVLVDAGGVVLSDSFEGDNYVGPHKVLNDAVQLLKKRS